MKKFLDKVLVTCFISIWVFILIMVGIFIFRGEVPSDLITGFFSIFGGEGILCAVITVVKKIMKNPEDDEDDSDVDYDE